MLLHRATGQVVIGYYQLYVYFLITALCSTYINGQAIDSSCSIIMITTCIDATTPSTQPTPTSNTPNDYETCQEDGVWPETEPGKTATASCFNRTVKANRTCNSDGEWGRIICFETPIFRDTHAEISVSPLNGLSTLSTQSQDGNITLNEAVFLCSFALNTELQQVNRSTAIGIGGEIETTTEQTFVEIFFDVINFVILQLVKIASEGSTRDTVIDILILLDRLVINFVEPTGELRETDAFFLRVLEVNNTAMAENASVLVIEVDNNTITLPGEIFTEPRVTVASFLFPNLSDLIPPVNGVGSIISPIISSTINCKTCPITNLIQNVTVQLKIDEVPLIAMSNSNDTTINESISCVFLNLSTRERDWDSSGCTTVSIDGDLVTCSCNHLTHFAILLSPKGPEISAIHYTALSIIDLVLVPISLLCMVMIILTYSLIRSLWSIRNYVHIMLCVSLFMAQLVFIVGVDKTENQDGCSAVAVILLYLFLVVFMWMLMEGVVLYVTLVRVLVNNHKQYVIGFTVASYVIPAVYMIVVIPIGYLVNTDDISDGTHFLYYQDSNDSPIACWLNYSTGFVWSFIAPVIIIVTINIGFFIMAIVIAKRQSQKHNMGVEIRHWILVTVSLIVVMGIAWLIGFLTFRKELIPFVYITTLFIAAQGIILFIILVPLNKKVRHAILPHFKKGRTSSHSKPSIYGKHSLFLNRQYSMNKSAILQARKRVTITSHYNTIDTVACRQPPGPLQVLDGTGRKGLLVNASLSYMAEPDYIASLPGIPANVVASLVNLMKLINTNCIKVYRHRHGDCNGSSNGTQQSAQEFPVITISDQNRNEDSEGIRNQNEDLTMKFWNEENEDDDMDQDIQNQYSQFEEIRVTTL